MTGNVMELCWDRYGDAYYGSGATDDPRGPASGSERVNRGGSWVNVAIGSRVAYRLRNDPSFRSDNFGFRPARGQ